MTKEKEEVYVDKKGKRIDGRTVEDLREIKIQVGVIPSADGSCYLEWGQNKVYASVFGPNECIPKHSSDPLKAVIKFNYRMASFSVPERKSPKPGRREIEISKVCAEALSRAVFIERFPGTQIEVETEIIDSNAGTRVAALTAAAVALADAGIPMKDLVSSCGVGKAGGELIIDLNKHEEDAPDAVDMPLAILPNSEEVVLLQMDGMLTKEEYAKLMEKGIEACKKVYEKQKEVLKEKYLKSMAEDEKNLKEKQAKEQKSEPVIQENSSLNSKEMQEIDESLGLDDSNEGGNFL